MKKLISLLLMLVLALSLSGCGEKNEDDKYILQEMKSVGIYSKCELVRWSLSQRVACTDEENDVINYLTIDEYYQLRYDNEDYYTRSEVDELLENYYSIEELNEIFDFANQDWIIQDFVDYIDDLEDVVEQQSYTIEELEKELNSIPDNYYTVYESEHFYAYVDGLEQRIEELEFDYEDNITLTASATHQDYVDWFVEYEDLIDDFIDELYRQTFYFDDILEDYEQYLSTKMTDGEQLSPEEVEFLLDYQARIIEWREFENWRDNELEPLYIELLDDFPKEEQEEGE